MRDWWRRAPSHPDFARTPADWGAYQLHLALTPYPNGAIELEGQRIDELGPEQIVRRRLGQNRTGNGAGLLGPSGLGTPCRQLAQIAQATRAAVQRAVAAIASAATLLAVGIVRPFLNQPPASDLFARLSQGNSAPLHQGMCSSEPLSIQSTLLAIRRK